jgi:endonuclease YncB( thermonuclease family)
MKNRRLVSLTLAALLSPSLPSSVAHAQEGADPRIGPCVAVRVVDSDAADLRCGSALVRVRLRDLAAPRSGQVGYTEAARALAELLRARELFVALDDPARPARDPSGRLLAYVFDRNGANLNVAFVLLGWASYSADAGANRFEKSFRAAEQSARSERRALWTIWSVSAEHAAER